MVYTVACIEQLEDIIVMKNEVKQRIIESGLNIWRDGYPTDDLIVEDINNGFARVIIEEGKIIAYASVYPSDIDYPSDTFLRSNLLSFGRIMVNNAYVGKGIGQYFVKQIIDEAKKYKYNGIGILADSFNDRAVHIYTKLGFKKESEVDFTYGYFDVLTLFFK